MYPYQVPTSLGGANLGLASPLTQPLDPLLGRGQMGFQSGVNLAGPTAEAGDDIVQRILKARPGADAKKIKEALKGAGTKAAETVKGAFAPMPLDKAVKLGTGRLGIAGGLLAGGLTAAEALQQDRPLEAAVGGAGAALGTVGGTIVGGIVGGAPGAFIGGSLGSMLGGQLGTAAEYIKRDITGDPIRGKDDLGNLLAQRKKLGELDNLLYRDQLGTKLSALTDLNQNFMNQQYTQAQRMLPLVNKMKDQELVRQQALINTQGQQAAMLGTLATAGALAQGAQREAGAMIRTALSTNPYAGSVAQAPQIRFG